MCSDCAVLLSIRVAAMSRTSAVRETVCLCKQLSFIDLCRTLNQAERWLCSVCVALWCLCWRWDKVHVKRMQEDLERTGHISVRQPQIRQGCLTESKTHCVFSRFERKRRGASSKSDHRTADRSPESPQPSAAIHSSAAPALPASPIQKLPQRSVRGRGGWTAVCNLEW